MKQEKNTSQNPQSAGSAEDGQKTSTGKRIAALLGIFLLLALYVVSLFVAIFDRSESGKWFMICLIATVTVPLLIWIYTWMYGMLKGRHTIASFDLNKDLFEEAQREAKENAVPDLEDQERGTK